MSNRSRRLGIIDLGTNTFHLLVVEKARNRYGFKAFHRERHFVNLAEGGINLISSQAWTRAIASMTHFRRELHDMGVDQIKAVGTAALRHAENAKELQDEILAKTGIAVEVIDGNLEAEYIARGVALVIPGSKRRVLIMDVGGGSVEMILRIDGENVFSRSYPIGVAVLYEEFHTSEPIDDRSLVVLDNHLREVLRDLLVEMEKIPGIQLVGASGTFEVLDSALERELEKGEYAEFGIDDFHALNRHVRAMTLAERLEHPGIPNSRARYIVVAMHLIDFISRYVSYPKVGISRFAMKEGIAATWLKSLD